MQYLLSAKEEWMPNQLLDVKVYGLVDRRLLVEKG
jgi:hypothetical protein